MTYNQSEILSNEILSIIYESVTYDTKDTKALS